MNNNPNNNKKKPQRKSLSAGGFFRKNSNKNTQPNPNSNQSKKLVKTNQPIPGPYQQPPRAQPPVGNNNQNPANLNPQATQQFATNNQKQQSINNAQPRRAARPEKKPGIFSRFFSNITTSIANFFKGPWTLGLVIRRGLTALGLLILVGIGFFFFFAATAPNITESELASENVTEIYDNQGNSVWSLSSQDRNYVDQSEIPQQLKDAIISIEDRRFYQHKGVDPIRIMGALVANFSSSSGLQGGSTLTQQLVKLSVFSTSTADQTLKRKAQEAWLSLKVERNFSKDEILTFYVNKVYESNGVYGMKTAARYFYGAELKDLNLSQTAVLAGIPQSPNNFDPYEHPDYLKDRRQEVLDAMLANKKITQEEHDQASDADVMEGIIPKEEQEVTGVSEKSLIVDAYVHSALNEAEKLGYDYTKDNLKIYTSLNSNIQKKLYDSVNGTTGVYMPDGLQVGATMTNPNNGRVIAQIGGRNLDSSLGLNRAVQTTRSSGSTAKPLIDYAPAVEFLNWPTYRTVTDEPYKYPGTNIQVANFDRKYQGNITMRKALAGSRNIPAIKTFMEVGPKNSAEFLNRVGIKTVSEELVASDAVGINFSTEQGAAAFSSFANGGTYYQPTYIERIVTSDGNATTFEAPKGEKAMKDSTSFEMVNMLKDVVKSGGTAPGAAVPGIYLAGKSGTVAYDPKVGQPEGAISDEWFIGFTKIYCLAIWTGYDEPNEPGNYIRESGISTPDQIFSQVMAYAMEGKDNVDWKAPDSVQAVTVNGVTEYEIVGADFDNGGQLDYSGSTLEEEVEEAEDQSEADQESSSSQTVPGTPTDPNFPDDGTGTVIDDGTGGIDNNPVGTGPYALQRELVG